MQLEKKKKILKNQSVIRYIKKLFLFQMDEIQSKSREIEKLEKLINQSIQINKKQRLEEDEKVSDDYSK